MAKSQMTKDQIKSLVETYRRDLLPEWKVNVLFLEHDDPAGSENSASVHRSGAYHEATISLYKGWETGWLDGDFRRLDGDFCITSTIVHELLHVLFRDVDFVFDVTKGCLHSDAQTLMGQAYNHAREGAIERIAQFITKASGAGMPAAFRTT